MPYVRLLVADGILWVVGGLASLAFVIPGLIITTLFALIGPLINMEDLSVRVAFRRSASLVAPRFLLVLFLITIPLGIEHELVNAIAYLEPHEHIWLVFFTLSGRWSQFRRAAGPGRGVTGRTTGEQRRRSKKSE